MGVLMRFQPWVIWVRPNRHGRARTAHLPRLETRNARRASLLSRYGAVAVDQSPDMAAVEAAAVEAQVPGLFRLSLCTNSPPSISRSFSKDPLNLYPSTLNPKP